MKLPNPSEFSEQCNFVDWLELQNLKFTSIPNSTWTTSIKQKVNNKKSGLRAGLPDLLIIIPKEKSKIPRAGLLFVEMKKVGTYKSALKQHQLDWIDSLNEIDNVEAKICYGYDDAVEFVLEFLVQ